MSEARGDHAQRLADCLRESTRILDGEIVLPQSALVAQVEMNLEALAEHEAAKPRGERTVPPPHYRIAKQGRYLVLRRMNFHRTHLVDLPTDWLTPTKWIGAAYMAFHAEAIALCGAVLKPDHRGLVAMQDGTAVGCPRCKRVAAALLSTEPLP